MEWQKTFCLSLKKTKKRKILGLYKFISKKIQEIGKFSELPIKLKETQIMWRFKKLVISTLHLFQKR